MGLESNIENAGKYISDLNDAWPLGTDTPDAGDDHIRGIKNVLLNTFPALTGAVTLTHTQINTGSVPSGSVMLFIQAAAPTGWTRKTGILATQGLRIVATASAGGGNGGTDDPVVNDKVVTHTHGLSGNTGAQSVDHYHAVTGSTAAVGNHTHEVGGAPNAGVTYQAYTAGNGFGYSIVNTQGAGAHSHTFSVNSLGMNTGHTHALSGNTAAPAGAVASWAPRYYDAIVAIKD